MTLPEILLWQQLRGRKLHGLQFRRQHPEDRYILDFYCAATRLAVEVDGISHESRGPHDRRRDRWLAERGIRVLRIPAVDILKDDNIESVLQAIAEAAAPSTAFGGPPPPLRGGGA
jgi:very-short-patch-repair endonuclease